MEKNDTKVQIKKIYSVGDKEMQYDKISNKVPQR
jgi:hypothetical protein